MTTRFGELDEYFDPGIEFTVAGKPYRINPPSAEVGLWCERLVQVAGGVREAKTDAETAAVMERIQSLPDLDDGDKTLAQRVLGAAYDELVADGVDHARIKFVGATAFLWIVGDEDAATRYWQAGGRPEAVAPNRSERRASRSTGAAGSTRKRGSTSGTTSPKPPSPARARRSGGKTS